MNSLPLLILDLDETLIHATDSPHDSNWDFELFSYKVYKRPYLDQFLATLKDYYTIAVWSSASDDYVAKVVEEIFGKDYPLLFVWGRSKATPKINYPDIDVGHHFTPFNHYHYVKRLSKVKRKFKIPLERMLIVDDTPFKCQYNYGNAVYLTEYNGEKEDTELKRLLSYLIKLSSESNFRTIEKRYWDEGA